MTDQNRAIMMTKHLHYNPQTGVTQRCPELQAECDVMFEKGYRHAEGFLKMNPDGSLDFTDAMYVFRKEGNNSHEIV